MLSFVFLSKVLIFFAKLQNVDLKYRNQQILFKLLHKYLVFINSFFHTASKSETDLEGDQEICEYITVNCMLKQVLINRE